MSAAGNETRQNRSTGRPSAKAAEQLEDDMMEAATAVFLACGFAGASMEAIARAAGVTKRTLYRRAKDKADLFVEVVERYGRRAGAPQLNHIEGVTLEQKLKTASDIMLTWFLAPEAIALYRLIISDAARQPGLGSKVEGPFRRATEAIAAILGEHGDRSAATLQLGADMFLRLITAEPLDRAVQGIVPTGMSPAMRDKAHICVEFFLAGWNNWRL